MHCDNNIHPGLAELLRFEEQRLGLPVEVHSRALNDLPAIHPFRPVVEVTIHRRRHDSGETFPILLSDELLEITAPVCVGRDEQSVGFNDRDGSLCPLAGVTGNRLNIYFDLNELFSGNGSVKRKPLNGSKLSGNPGNRVAELIFSQALPVILGNIRRYNWGEERERYARMKLDARMKMTSEWRRSVRDNDRLIEEKTWEVSNLARKNMELRDRLRTHNLFTRKRLEREAGEEHRLLVQMLGRSIRALVVGDEKLDVLTAPININYDGYEYEFGSFSLELPLGSGHPIIKPADSTHVVDGYPHPHISSDHVPCLGNIGATVAQLTGEGKLYEAVTLLLEFLRSYNPDNPYLRIEKWDPDWEDDDDRFESCYNNASLSDCATCSDWDCSYKDGAARRCLENTDTEDCIECAACDLRDDAVRGCREGNEPFECVECGVSCPWAGNARLCRDSHDGEECPGCSNSDCEYHGREEEAAAAA